jgi:hypothetical protein
VDTSDKSLVTTDARPLGWHVCTSSKKEAMIAKEAFNMVQLKGSSDDEEERKGRRTREVKSIGEARHVTTAETRRCYSNSVPVLELHPIIPAL